ncbi:MAG: ROK family transcriptional regulator [Anaerolineae bacterium]
MKQFYQTGDQTLLREINLSTVLRYLQAGPAVSRAGLANLTGLNKTTVSSLVEELLERGLVHEIGLATSAGGRPATLLELNPQAGRIIGVELGVDFISVILTNLAGQLCWRRVQETDPAQPQEAIIDLALCLVNEAGQASQAEGMRLLGLGLSVPGMVNVESATLLFSPNLQWRNVPLGQIFAQRTGVTVLVENDANAAALAEHFFGVARQVQNFIFLSIGVGIGGGLFLNGNLYRGASGLAGEIGHTTSLMSNGNRPCRCGNRGCWETSSNQYALIERVRALLDVGQSSLVTQLMAEQNSRLTLAVIAQAAGAGDAVALEALAETGTAIGLGVANLINTFNPEMVVVGGAMSVTGDYLLPAIKEVISKRTLIETQPQIVLSTFGPAASVIGAAALVVNAILASPSRVERMAEPLG